MVNDKKGLGENTRLFAASSNVVDVDLAASWAVDFLRLLPAHCFQVGH